ncbi:hypothetical protein B0T16DRAFT_459843 [Cercophora newfieldiana]|uniref:SnoaL-like domain-containing protein n=1 Tax=Cercophora newfieldiana TaxID=92897 RepID=A0AA40CLU3_9PEZI|nr:hypothetical protein B0T16DRAFT_459843 [Cercophora newfieldiana]
MAFPTQPSFVVHAKGWDSNLLAHPVPRFLYAHEEVFDAKDLERCKPFYASDMTYTKSNGQIFSGDAAVTALHGDYALFTDVFHEPVYGSISETANGGYRLIGWAKMFVNLPGGGEKKHVDLQGREWECLSNGAFIFDLVKDSEGPQGFRMKSMQIFADPTPILGEAIKRGIVPVEALAA